MALAYKGDDTIGLANVGEGTTADGDLHKALTFASGYDPPVILCITDNQWAISSFQAIAGGSETTFAAKAIGYGLPGLRVDANGFLAFWGVTLWAAKRALTNHDAPLIEPVTYRAAGYSTSGDPTRYARLEKRKHWPFGDPRRAAQPSA